MQLKLQLRSKKNLTSRRNFLKQTINLNQVKFKLKEERNLKIHLKRNVNLNQMKQSKPNPQRNLYLYHKHSHRPSVSENPRENLLEIRRNVNHQTKRNVSKAEKVQKKWNKRYIGFLQTNGGKLCEGKPCHIHHFGFRKFACTLHRSLWKRQGSYLDSGSLVPLYFLSSFSLSDFSLSLLLSRITRYIYIASSILQNPHTYTTILLHVYSSYNRRTFSTHTHPPYI